MGVKGMSKEDKKTHKDWIRDELRSRKEQERKRRRGGELRLLETRRRMTRRYQR